MRTWTAGGRAGGRAGQSCLVGAAAVFLSASACSDPGLARSHIWDDGGSATTPAPALVVPATPTSQELAYYRIDGTRLGGLKQKLTAALEPPATIQGRPGQSLSIALNLDAAGVEAANAGTIRPRCVPGLAVGNDGNGCMMPLSDAERSRTRLFNYNPPDDSLSLFNPVFDSRLRQGVAVVGPLAPFLPVNSTAEPALFEHPRIGLGPSISLLADFILNFGPDRAAGTSAESAFDRRTA